MIILRKFDSIARDRIPGNFPSKIQGGLPILNKAILLKTYALYESLATAAFSRKRL